MGSLKESAEMYNSRKKKLDSIVENFRLINLCLDDPDSDFGIVRVRKDILKKAREIIAEYGDLLASSIGEEDCKYFDCSTVINKKLDWISSRDGLDRYKYGDLLLAYQPGYPLMIADWKVGHGYRDVRTGESIDPTRVAFISLPDKDGEE